MTTIPREQLRLETFEDCHAGLIAGWVTDEQQLHWLAPSTAPPLTAEKVLAWKRPDQDALVFIREAETRPLAYGELNQLRHEVDHLWIGHVVLQPDERGRGIGRLFVTALLGYAFEVRNATRVSLIVFPDNAPAVRCYLAAGFTCMGDEFHKFGEDAAKHRFLRFEATASSFG